MDWLSGLKFATNHPTKFISCSSTIATDLTDFFRQLLSTHQLWGSPWMWDQNSNHLKKFRLYRGESSYDVSQVLNIHQNQSAKYVKPALYLSNIEITILAYHFLQIRNVFISHGSRRSSRTMSRRFLKVL